MEKASKYDGELRRKLAERGLRITEQRKGLLKLVLQAEHPLTALGQCETCQMEEYTGASHCSRG